RVGGAVLCSRRSHATRRRPDDHGNGGPSMTVDNPLLEPTLERVAPPAILVVFGASGDLTSRKLMPAVERLALRRLLPGGFSVVGVARTPTSDEEFLTRRRTHVAEAGGARA